MESLLLRLGNEVRQTLHHVTGLIGLAEEEPLSETQTQYLERSRESADELVRTVNDLTELARPGATVVNLDAFSPAEAVAEIAEVMSSLAFRKGLTFDWMIEGAVPASIRGDKALMQDMLRRLIDNAIRFTHEGGVQVLVAAAPANGESIEIDFKIADSGPGIPEETLSALESPLTASPLQGLGLRIVRKRAAELGGRLLVSSEIYGTVVRLSLPAAALQEAVLTAKAGKMKSTLGTAPLRLLVAEDSDESFLLFQAYTASEGHEVVRALNGMLAVEMAKRGNYDFIVMDANMPVMDGYTATRMIREWETNAGQPRKPILLLSADDLQLQMQQGGAAGCSGYLTKPTTKAKLLTALAYYARPALEEQYKATPIYGQAEDRVPGRIC